jgi:PKD repeat protein
MRISLFFLCFLFYSTSVTSQVNTCGTNYLCDGTSALGNADWPADCPDGSDEILAYCCANANDYSAYGVDVYGMQACSEYFSDINTCDSYLCDGNNIIGNASWANDCTDGSDEDIEYCCINAANYSAYGTNEAGITACAEYFGGGGGGETSYNCSSNSCVEIDGSGGQYQSLVDCQEACGGGGETSYNCSSNSCVEIDGSGGQYQSLVDCQEACGGGDPTSCLYTLILTDSYGDGWNGGEADVLMDGESVFSNDGESLYGEENGVSVSESNEVDFINGSEITITWTSGEYDDEVSIIFLNSTGVPVGTFSPDETPDFSLTVDCGSTTNNGTLEAGFSAYPLDVNIGDNVTFVDTSLGVDISSWLWDFGDGNSSDQQQPIHSYGAPGTYDITLTVQNASGSAQEFSSDYITVSDPCISGDQVILTNLAFTDGNSESGSIWESYYEFPTSISYNNTNPLNLLDPGRYVRFKIQAYNNLDNGTNLVGASCEIFCDDEYAEITDATAGLNNVAWNDSGWSTDEFEVYISPNTPPGHIINFDFKVTQFENSWFTRCVKLPVRPIIISNMVIDDDANPDSNGDGDEIIEEGETVEALPLAENVSTLSVPLLGGQFYSSSNCVDVWNGVPGSSGVVVSSSWWNYQFNEPQSIEAGDGNLQPQFDFVFDYSCDNTPFELSVLFSGGFELFDISNLPFGLGLSNKKSLIRFSSPTGYNGWVETNIDDIDNHSSIEVFPNPTSGYVNVIFTNINHESMTLKLTNVLGEVIYSESLTNFIGQYNNEIDLNKNPKGIYFLEISSPTNSYSKKIILQ